MPGLILSAPSSGAGKTMITLGLLRALSDRGHPLAPAKSGPDYIDPAFHKAAARTDCINLDAWAMTPDRIQSLAATDDLRIIEGAMGLFDAAANGRGATADLARILSLPVILIMDCARMAHSAAAILRGFASHDPQVQVAGVILNNIGSARHAAMISGALSDLGIPILGSVPRSPNLAQPSRHLGLVQATERQDLEAFLTAAAALIEAQVDIQSLLDIAAPLTGPTKAPRIAPPAQNIAIARDEAFAFSYPHMLADWRAAGATLSLFSPLANDPVPQADFIFLPGGYPELHAGRLSQNTNFMQSLQNAAQSSVIYGECGGYMALGTGLTDADGSTHQMAGLLPLETSFANPRRHLGYRTLTAQTGPIAGTWSGHEFHYASTVHTSGLPLFTATDALGDDIGPMGLIQGRVMGSFAHIIDRMS